MADIIRLLPDSVANQIAAGEVIQRPASVIKELVENAVDAGATEIHIEVKDAGKTLIRVADNGIGMSETDARMAFERHATSKIRQAEDLFSLRSMGFRGEALPSICAISEVEIKTRTAENPVGTRLVIVGSNMETQEPTVCDKGTIICVKKLFFNVPARRKFLKSDSSELSAIMREFERLALVNNNLRMSIDSGTRRIDLRPATLKRRIEEIWKNSLSADSLIPVDVDTTLVKIEGFVSRPEFARRRNPLQYFIVNGRNMRHPYFHKAVLSCFQGLIASDTQPCYFLKFTVDPASIDVNIHPTKNEIKFEYEHEIWPILVSAVKTSLGKNAAVPSIDFTSDPLPLEPIHQGDAPRCPTPDFSPDYNPFKQDRRQTRVDSNWQTLYENFRDSAPGGPSAPEMPQPDTATLFEESQQSESQPICMQYAMKYIVTTSLDGLMLIDQHRAHVKILYEENMRRAEHAEVVSQSVMFPETVELSESQLAAFGEVSEELQRAGFRIEYDSDNRFHIMGVPASSSGGDSASAADIVLRILDSVIEDSANYGSDSPTTAVSVRQKVALVMARSAAIRRGVRLSQDEMENLVSRLFSLPDPSFTPSGNPIFTVLNDERISRLLQ